jgi:hypothetical protein
VFKRGTTPGADQKHFAAKRKQKRKRSFNIEALVYDLDLYHRPFHLFFSFSLERKSFENAPQVGGGTFLKRSIDSTHRQTPACG